METIYIEAERKHLELFKSYYVVWKLYCSAISNAFSTWFKSYYVVWKPPTAAGFLRMLLPV